MSQTIDAVERELGDQGLLRRWTGAIGLVNAAQTLTEARRRASGRIAA
jgi:hypothetical protein